MSNPFPYLTNKNCRLTSPATPAYNCIAWAAQETHRWWWPIPGLYFWPAGVPYEETVEAFVAAFKTLASNSAPLAYTKTVGRRL